MNWATDHQKDFLPFWYLIGEQEAAEGIGRERKRQIYRRGERAGFYKLKLQWQGRKRCTGGPDSETEDCCRCKTAQRGGNTPGPAEQKLLSVKRRRKSETRPRHHRAREGWPTQGSSCWVISLRWAAGSASFPPQLCPSGSSRRTPAMPSSPRWVCTRVCGWAAPHRAQDKCSARSLTRCSRWTVSTMFHHLLEWSDICRTFLSPGCSYFVDCRSSYRYQVIAGWYWKMRQISNLHGLNTFWGFWWSDDYCISQLIPFQIQVSQ